MTATNTDREAHRETNRDSVRTDRQQAVSRPHEDSHAIRQRAGLIISLDFELMWGLRDLPDAADYRKSILGVREAIPAMLSLFQEYDVHATWATVGMLLFDTRSELEQHLPAIRPTYSNRRLSPYPALAEVGRNERTDPWHFGLSLATQIVESAGQELASHTFCHYYCLEPGQSLQQFDADMSATVHAIGRIADPPRSLVFPRNQTNASYLACCRAHGIDVFRGNESHWAYAASSAEANTSRKRMFRLVDAYANISGHHGIAARQVDGCINLPSSRFLRPHSRRLRRLNGVRLRRVLSAMRSAFLADRAFHLWWHPHNFGDHVKENLEALSTVLQEYRRLRNEFDAPTFTMSEYADCVMKPTMTTTKKVA